MTITQQFEELYRSEQAGVARKVAQRLRPGDDQEALVQEAFTQLYEAMAAGKASNPRALLYVIADRRAVNEAKRREYAENVIERLGVSDSRLREQQALYAHKVRDTSGWNDSTPVGFKSEEGNR